MRESKRHPPPPLARVLCLLLLVIVGVRSAAEDEQGASVGRSVWIRDLVLPGPELEVKPADFSAPVVLRIAASYPHGTDHRYDLVYYGLEPGKYDLRDYLQRRDGSSTDDLPAIPVTVVSVLPPGQVRPNPTTAGELPRLGGYRTFLWIVGTLWVVGFVILLVRGRKHRRRVLAANRGPLTLAERLRPLVEAARAGTLSAADRADLELALIAFWRHRAGLGNAGAAEALAALRHHEEAGPLLRALEDWLHRPSSDPADDLGDLLVPYQDLPAEILDAPPAEAD